MARSRWIAFPHPNKAFDYAGDKLAKSWAALHAGDQEPFPDAKWAAMAIKATPQPKLKLDAASLAAAAQDAWRAFHRGDFEDAFDGGASLGAWGVAVACKAQGIHAARLLDDDKLRTVELKAAAERAASAAALWPQAANAHYQHAYALGRYSQVISITQALSLGLAGKVKTSLDTTIRLAPRHAEAMLALAMYHAEIVAKVGSMIAGLTYGAKGSTAEQHMAAALKLIPQAPIAHIEHGNLLMALYGAKREDDAAAAYAKAASMKPRDAMEALDVAYAKTAIE